MSVEVPGKSVVYLLVLALFLSVYCYFGVRRRLRDHRANKLGQHKGSV
jgi:hypothetical protein